MDIATLTPRKVSEIACSFFVPNYQRGYRWGRHNVRQLLNDISESHGSYYLQPVVVCPHIPQITDQRVYDFDVIDGQQRLTTLLIIYKVLQEKCRLYNDLGVDFLDKDSVVCGFSLSYQTRIDSESFLKDICVKQLVDSQGFADYLYMYHVCKEVEEWFGNKPVKLQTIADALRSRVFLIWYEVNATEDQARQLFENLNIGKIRLTNAELVKAIFLSKNDSKISDADQNIIGQQWDEMERKLHDKVLWSFLTKKPADRYATRIELLFDMIAKKNDNERDEFFTFLYFDQLLKGKNQKEEWEKIYIQYLKLLDWYQENEYYHKVGYLVSVGLSDTLQTLYTESMGDNMTNSKFKKGLDSKIKATLNFDKLRIEHLSYGSDKKDVTKLLTLFNVITTYNLKDETQKYPFYLHNTVKGGWSIEHIHAQQSEPINDILPRREWMKLHHASLLRYRSVRKSDDCSKEELTMIDELSKRMSEYLSNENLQTQNNFNAISRRYAETVVSRLDSEYKDLLGNLALLGRDDNSILNNSTFDVKREIVTKELMAISYIPICTQHVFLKKYTPADKNNLFFWSDDDRTEYIKEIKRVLRDYLPSLDALVCKLLSKVGEEFMVLWNEFESATANRKTSRAHILMQYAQVVKREQDPLAFYEALYDHFEDNGSTEEIKKEFEQLIKTINDYE